MYGDDWKGAGMYGDDWKGAGICIGGSIARGSANLRKLRMQLICKPQDGYTALMEANTQNCIKTVKILLSFKVDLEAKDQVDGVNGNMNTTRMDVGGKESGSLHPYLLGRIITLFIWGLWAAREVSLRGGNGHAHEEGMAMHMKRDWPCA